MQSFSSSELVVRIRPDGIVLYPVRADFSTAAELAFLVAHKFYILHAHHQCYILLPQIYLPPLRPEAVREQHHLFLVSSASLAEALVPSGSLNLIQFKAVIDRTKAGEGASRTLLSLFPCEARPGPMGVPGRVPKASSFSKRWGT